MTINEKALELHEKWNGKLDTVSKVQVKTREDLALAYTPGVAEPCKVIAEDPEAAYRYTIKSNTVAVVSDGSAVLGLGNIGPLAAMPVMEGKAVLFKEFGGINAFPICLDTQDTEEIIETVVRIAPAFGGINLEDISAPRCFEIEERLKKLLNIPVFHDDQHGTAIVVLAGIINALKVTGKKKEDCRVVVNGAGSAGVAITKLEETESILKDILSDDPDHVQAGNALAYLWVTRDMNLPEARRLLEHAYRLSPVDPYVLDSMGWLCFKEGRYDQAAEFTLASLKRLFDVEVACHLVEILAVSGRDHEAEKLFRELEQRAGSDALVLDLAKRLNYKTK